MKLKNYTTSVAAEKTIMEIEKLLVSFGATRILKDMLGDGKVSALIFQYQNKPYKLPINSEGVNMVLTQGKRLRYGTNQAKERKEQAYRTAWRIIKDWLHSQLSLIVSGQAQPDQILMPYQFDGKQTLYEAYQKGLLRIEGKRQDDINSLETKNGGA
jgi:hypothetical protein